MQPVLGNVQPVLGKKVRKDRRLGRVMRGMVKSKYLTSVMRGQRILRYTGKRYPVTHVETISGHITKGSVQEIMSYLSNARDIGVQRLETLDRKIHFRDKLMSGKLNSISVAIVVLRVNGVLMLFLVDGGHKCTAIYEVMNSGVSVDVDVEIRVFEAVTEDDLREKASEYDPRSSARSAGDMIHTAFGLEESNKKMAHIRLLNTAMQNIRVSCPDGDMARMEECDPMFLRMRILSYEGLKHIRYNETDTLNWFYENFPFPSSKRRPINVGVFTAMMLTYKLALAGKIPQKLEEVTTIWRNYSNGMMPVKSGYEEMVHLRDRIIGNPNSGGGGASKYYQRSYYHHAICAFNMVCNHGKANVQVFKDGSHYLVGKGLVVKTNKIVKGPKKAKKAKKAKKVVVSAFVKKAV